MYKSMDRLLNLTIILILIINTVAIGYADVLFSPSDFTVVGHPPGNKRSIYRYEINDETDMYDVPNGHIKYTVDKDDNRVYYINNIYVDKNNVAWEEIAILGERLLERRHSIRNNDSLEGNSEFGWVRLDDMHTVFSRDGFIGEKQSEFMPITKLSIISLPAQAYTYYIPTGAEDLKSDDLVYTNNYRKYIKEKYTDEAGRVWYHAYNFVYGLILERTEISCDFWICASDPLNNNIKSSYTFVSQEFNLDHLKSTDGISNKQILYVLIHDVLPIVMIFILIIYCIKHGKTKIKPIPNKLNNDNETGG